jgi:hypothetical protein
MTDTPRSEPQPEPQVSADAGALPGTGPMKVQVSPQGHVTITVQPTAAAAPPDLSLGTFAARGLAGFSPSEQGAERELSQRSALQQVLDKLNNALDTLGTKIVEFADDVTTLEVRTFVSDRIEDVRPDGANGFEFAQQRAMTYIDFDGDTQVVVPVDAGQIDEALWQIHLQTVQAAQAHRAEMLKTIGELVQGFIPTLK